jgi:hypothetical protein
MAKEWDSFKLVEYVKAAGAKGRTKSKLQEKIPKMMRSQASSILGELKSSGAIRGPFKNRSDYYFAPQFAPTREQAEDVIEKPLRQAGTRLTARSDLEKKASGFHRTFFNDALASLKGEAKIVELQGSKKTTFYVHRDAVLEQLRLPSAVEPEQLATMPVQQTAVTLDDIRPIYNTLKAEQGGISTVKIYDIMTRLGASREDVHRILLREAKSGRVSLHPASTVKFPSEVMAAGIRLQGQADLLVTVVLKEDV